MVDKLNYSNVVSEGQTLLWGVFKNNAVLKDMTTNILDKEPENFNRGTGYPLLIVPEPQISADDVVGLRKHHIVLFWNCVVYTLRTDVMRKMHMNMRSAISTNRVLLASYGLNNFTAEGRTLPFPLDDGRMAYRSEFTVRAETVVNGAPDD